MNLNQNQNSIAGTSCPNSILNVVGKICTKCNKVKPFNEFRKQSKNRDGLSYYCKNCLAPMVEAGNKRRYKLKKNEIIQQNMEWQKKNKDKMNIYAERSKKKLQKLKESSIKSNN